jgi:hypothetical protein
VQLAHYIRNDIPDIQEEILHGVVHDRSLIFGAPRSRRKSYSTPGDRSQTPQASTEQSADSSTVPALEKSPEAAIPLSGLTRHSSIRRSLRQTSGPVPARKSVSNIAPEFNSAAETSSKPVINRPEIWTEKRPLLRKVTAERSSQLSNKVRPNKSVAEQITEMIDRALDGRSDSTDHLTPRTPVHGYFGNYDGHAQKRNLNCADLPHYIERFMESRSDISPGAKQATEKHDPYTLHVPHHEQPPHWNDSIHNQVYDGRYTHKEENVYSASSTDIPGQHEHRPSAKKQESHTKQRACTYSHRYPPKHLKENSEASRGTAVLRMRSISSPPCLCPGKVSCNDQYAIYVCKEPERDGKVHIDGESFVVSDRSRKHSLRSQRTHASRARRASVNRPERSSNQGSKRWKWWKLVLVDKEESPAGSEADSRDERSWRDRSHPLANQENEDEGYETSELVETLERTVKEQQESSARPASHRKEPSAFSTHSLADCGHENDDDNADDESQQPENPEKVDTNLAIDGSSDNERQKAALSIPAGSNMDATTSNTLVNVSAENHGAVVEVRAGETDGEVVDGAQNNFRGVKVIVTVEQGLDSAIVKVEIRPRRR